MRFSSYASVGLLWAGLAFANDCNKSVNITSQSDADGISSCTTISDITISDDVSGSIKFPNLENITGNLSTHAENLTSLSVPKLQRVGTLLELYGTSSLKELDLGSLDTVGSLVWYKSAAEPSYSFSDSGLTTVDNVTIVQTGIRSIDWLQMETVGELALVFNPGLGNITLPTLKNFTGEVNFGGYEDDISVSLPKATAGASLVGGSKIKTLEVDSLRNLTKLTFNSSDITKFTAPELTEVESIYLHDNNDLAEFSMPKLKTVTNITYDDYDIATNFSFPVLDTIENNALFNSNISNLELPEIKHIYGNISAVGFNYESMGCADFRTRFLPVAYQIYCNLIAITTPGGDSGYPSTESITNSSNARPTTSAGSDSASTGESSKSGESGQSTSSSSSVSGSGGSGGLSSGAKAGIAVGVIVGALAIAGAAFFFIRRRRVAGGNEEALGRSESGRPREIAGPEVSEAPNTQRVEAPGSQSEMAAELEHPRLELE